MEIFLTVVATLISALIANAVANSMADKRMKEERRYAQQIREEDTRREETLRAEAREEERIRSMELHQREDFLRKQDYQRKTNRIEHDAVIAFVDLCYAAKASLARQKTDAMLDLGSVSQVGDSLQISEVKIFTFVIQQMERIVTQCYLLSINVSNPIVHRKVAEVHAALADANISGFTNESGELASYVRRNNNLPLPQNFEQLLMELATVAKFQYQEFDSLPYNGGV